MATLVIKTNAAQGSAVTIRDVGVIIPASGGSDTFTLTDEIALFQTSQNLRTYLTDNAHGANSSTLILNNGTGDIAQADALNFLDTLLLPDGDADYGVLKTDATGEVYESITFDGTATVTDLRLGNSANAGGFTITNLGTPSVGSDAATKSYVDSLNAGGRIWKELVLSEIQLDSTNNCIDQAIAFYLDGQPTANDIFVIKDASTTETFTFKAAESVAFDVAIGVDTNTTMSNLSQAINDDSTLWKAEVATTLQSINDGSGSSTAGRVVVIARRNQTSSSFTDRIYGTISTQAFGQYVNYNGESDYDRSTSSTLPSADPAQKQFGFGRVTADLANTETHAVRTTDAHHVWDADGGTWQNIGTSSIVAGAGLTKTGNTIDIGTGNGITVNADSIEVDFGESGDIQSLGNAISAGVLNESARADHVHTHGDRGGDSAGSQHDADQVDVETTLSRIGAPASVETVFSNVNTNFGLGRYVGKHHDFSQTIRVPTSGTLYLISAGGVVGSAVPIRMLRAGSIVGGSIQVDVADSTRAYKLSIQINGSEVASIALATSTLGAHSTALSASYSAGDLLRCAVIRTSGSGTSDFSGMVAAVELMEG